MVTPYRFVFCWSLLIGASFLFQLIQSVSYHSLPVQVKNLAMEEDESEKFYLSTLHNAMKNMSDSCFNKQKASGIFDDNSFLIPVKYHRICYQNYTSKHNQSYRQGIDFDQGCGTDIHNV